MLSTVIHYFALFTHTAAPFAILLGGATIVWLLVMGRKWKTEDPERWNRNY